MQYMSTRTHAHIHIHTYMNTVIFQLEHIHVDVEVELIQLLAHEQDKLLISKDAFYSDVSVCISNKITPLKSTYGQLSLHLVVVLVGFALDCVQMFHLVNAFHIAGLDLCQTKWWFFARVEYFGIQPP